MAADHEFGSQGHRPQAFVGRGLPQAICDRSSPAEPPQFADFMLTLMLSEAKGDAIIGDRNERFEQDCQRFGAERARGIYWGRALISMWPLIRRVVARAIRWGIIAEYARRFF